LGKRPFEGLTEGLEVGFTVGVAATVGAAVGAEVFTGASVLSSVSDVAGASVMSEGPSVLFSVGETAVASLLSVAIRFGFSVGVTPPFFFPELISTKTSTIMITARTNNASINIIEILGFLANLDFPPLLSDELSL
jgi:hypothetical protein